MTFHELRSDLADTQAFEKGDEFEFDLDGGAKDNSLRRSVDRILDLVGPDIFHGLQNQHHPLFAIRYGERTNAYHRMRQLQCTRLQGANDAQRLPHDDILRILASDLGLKAIRHVGIRQPLDTLWQRSIEDDVERILVVSGT